MGNASPREQIESAAIEHKWSVHYGGYKRLTGLTLIRGERCVWVDLDGYRGRVIGAYSKPEGIEIKHGHRDKLARVLRLVESSCSD